MDANARVKYNILSYEKATECIEQATFVHHLVQKYVRPLIVQKVTKTL